MLFDFESEREPVAPEPAREIPPHPRDARVSVASSGDPEADQRSLDRWRQSEERVIEGICPNGCAPLIETPATLTEPPTRTCPKCGYVHQTFAINARGV